MQIKTMKLLHNSRMANIKKQNKTENKCWEGYGETGSLANCLWECNKMVQLLQKTVWQCLKKLKRELPYDPANPLLGVYTEELKA